MVKRRKSCSIGVHKDLRVISLEPVLLWCPVCEHYLGDQVGSVNYGPDRPMLPAA